MRNEHELEVNNLKLSPAEQEKLRFKIIRTAKKNLKPNGKPNVSKVAEICECSMGHVSGTWKKYLEGGIGAVKSVTMGRPANSGALTVAQQEEIKRLITDKCPDQLKMKGFLWDRERVGELVYRMYKVRLTVQGTGKYLKKWGFTPQRPVKRSYKQSPDLVRKWLDEEYPAIKARARAEGAEITWGDETGCQNESNYIKGYAPKGKTPVLPVGSEHIRVNMISTVTGTGKVRYMFYREKMNGRLLITFMQRLVRDSGRKTFLILDNLRVHHSKAVTAWLDRHRDEIEVFYLPPYSPELNPDEYLNGNLKREMAKKGYSKSPVEVESKARGIMKKIQQNPAHAACYFRAEHIRYAA